MSNFKLVITTGRLRLLLKQMHMQFVLVGDIYSEVESCSQQSSYRRTQIVAAERLSELGITKSIHPYM